MMTSAPHSNLVAIIDDDEAVRDSLGTLLNSAGYRVLLFSSATSFLSETAARQVSAIVLDNGMPDMTGLDLIEQLRNEKRRTPVILISGNMTKSVRARAEQLGSYAVFEKPLASGVLLTTLRELGVFPAS
jgi:two-component system, LuxR family, response regulator FixJ